MHSNWIVYRKTYTQAEAHNAQWMSGSQVARTELKNAESEINCYKQQQQQQQKCASKTM